VAVEKVTMCSCKLTVLSGQKNKFDFCAALE